MGTCSPIGTIWCRVVVPKDCKGDSKKLFAFSKVVEGLVEDLHDEIGCNTACSIPVFGTVLFLVRVPPNRSMEEVGLATQRWLARTLWKREHLVGYIEEMEDTDDTELHLDDRDRA